LHTQKLISHIKLQFPLKGIWIFRRYKIVVEIMVSAIHNRLEIQNIDKWSDITLKNILDNIQVQSKE
jgi:hypothetical protein